MTISGRPRESLPTVDAALTDCESMIVATARGPLPISRRIRPARWSRIWPITPQAAQRAMNPQTVRQGGKPAGWAHHLQPVSTT